MTNNVRKLTLITGIAAVLIYVIVEILNVVGLARGNSSTVLGIMFIFTNAIAFILATNSHISKVKKTVYISLMILSVVAGLFYTINMFSNILDFTPIIAVVGVMFSIAHLVIYLLEFENKSKTDAMADITYIVGLVLLVVLSIAFIKKSFYYNIRTFETVQTTTSVALICCALTSLRLTKCINNKVVKYVCLSLACVEYILPIIFLIRGFFGLPRVFINIIAIISVVGVLGFALTIAANEFKMMGSKNTSIKSVFTTVVWSCNNCSKDDNEGDFCENCGTKKPELWTCSNCGKTGNTKNFCGKCGQKKEI